MTAVVGILNKDAIAIAADSAVTISGLNGTKILNSANKIFRLSKYHPVGVMLYNSASFMGTPWETIIKLYRSQLRDVNFESLADFTKHFIEFLHLQNFFTSKEIPETYIGFHLQDFFERVLKEEEKEEIIDGFISKEANDILLGKIMVSFNNFRSLKKTQCIVPEFVDFSRGEYDGSVKPIADKIIEEIFLNNKFELSAEFIEETHKTLYEFIRSEQIDGSYTGLIFCGFGQLDLYPLLEPINISFSINNRLHYYVQEEQKGRVSYANQGVIRTFAQQDVMRTFLSGIDPDLERTFTRNAFQFVSKFNQTILDLIGEENKELREKIEAINIKPIVDSFLKSNRRIKHEKYTKPLHEAVASLSKQDLAEMAESLIYLTYLKRRITFAEESVGGPVDVAVISKGDGFVWIKRKQYFEPKLNQHFFDNYYNI